MENNQSENYGNKKLKQKYLNFKVRVKRDVNWNLEYINLRLFKILNKIRFMPSTFITLTFYILVVGLFIYYIVGDKNVEGLILNTNITGEKFNPSDLVNQQISMTLLVLTVVSLMSNIDNKYIYGEKAIEVIFNKKGLFSIKVIFNTLISIMLINITLLIKEANNLSIIVCFLFAVLIIVYITFRFTTIYTNPEKIKIKWQILYLKENEKHIRKAKPLEPNLSMRLERFKNITVQYIRTDDSRYIENIDVYFKLLKVCLFNNRELIQEYYTEMINYGDFIAHISVFAEILYRENKYDESIRIYKELYKILNYYEVVLVQDIVTNGKVEEYINIISNTKTRTEIKDLQYDIFYIIENYWKQLYLYSTIDLSYCRLSREGSNLIYYFTQSDILEKYYCAIVENKNLNEEEKKELIMDLYDRVRMLRLDKTFEWNTVTNFKNKERFNKEKIIYPDYLYAEPIVLMILKTVEKKDVYSFKLFLSMNLEDKLINYIKLLCLISLLEATIRGEKQYYLDIKITTLELEKSLEILNITEIKFTIDELYSLYSNFIELYSKDKDRKSNKKYVYSFHPRLIFNASTIQSVFYYIAMKNGIEKDNEEINSLKGEISMEIIDILNK